MEHTPGPKWYLTELNDGIQWLTDGDFGMNPAAAPELLEALEELADEQALFAPQLPPIYLERLTRARAAIKAAKGDA